MNHYIFTDSVVQMSIKVTHRQKSITFSPCEPVLLAVSGPKMSVQFRDIRYSNKYTR